MWKKERTQQMSTGLIVKAKSPVLTAADLFGFLR